MPLNSKSANREETNAYNGPRSTVYSEPWWNSAVYNTVSPGLMRENASDSSSLEQSVDGQSQSDGGINEEDDDAPEKSQSTVPLHAVGERKVSYWLRKLQGSDDGKYTSSRP